MAPTGFTPSRVPTQRRTPPSDKGVCGCLYSVLCLHTRTCAAKRVTSSADPVRDDSGSSSEEVELVTKKKGSGKAKEGEGKEQEEQQGQWDAESQEGQVHRGHPRALDTGYVIVFLSVLFL